MAFDLFPDIFVDGVKRLTLAVRPAPPRNTHGDHLSPRAGASLEFRDYQPYAPGDDLRRVDWAVYGRTRHLFVRRYERPTAVPVFVVVDGSRSMTVETPSRFDTAARLTVAVASAAVAGHNPLRVMIADGRATHAKVIRGRGGVAGLMADLEVDRSVAGPGPSIVDTLHALLPALATQGRGILVIISDFFETQGVHALVDVLRNLPQQLVLLQVTQPADADPAVAGDVDLEDCETQSRLQVSIEASVLARYTQAYRAYFDELRDYATSRGAVMTAFDAASDTLPQLATLFPGGVLSLHMKA